MTSRLALLLAVFTLIPVASYAQVPEAHGRCINCPSGGGGGGSYHRRSPGLERQLKQWASVKRHHDSALRHYVSLEHKGNKYRLRKDYVRAIDCYRRSEAILLKDNVNITPPPNTYVNAGDYNRWSVINESNLQIIRKHLAMAQEEYNQQLWAARQQEAQRQQALRQQQLAQQQAVQRQQELERQRQAQQQALRQQQEAARATQASRQLPSVESHSTTAATLAAGGALEAASVEARRGFDTAGKDAGAVVIPGGIGNHPSDPVVPQEKRSPRIASLESQREDLRKQAAALEEKRKSLDPQKDAVAISSIKQQQSDLDGKVNFLNYSITQELNAPGPRP